MAADTLFGQAPSALTLLQFTTAIGDAVRRVPVLQGAWVVAELSDVRVAGGHCYMELIEKNQAGQTVAKLRATIWQSRFQYIRHKFYGATGRDITTGLKVMLFGAASHHQLYGLSFTVNDIDPSYTLGDMERLRREILEALSREGIMDRNKALEMSPAPQRIAVISAEGAAGYGDFMNHLMGNQEGFVFYPHLIPAVMQGERTSASVRQALEFVEQTIDLWDCVAIVRGGGATTDLNGFDDYELARAVALFPLPVIVGIGHERDRTVLDEIAHTRLKTPTAVAAYFVDTLRGSYEHTCSLAEGVARYTSERLNGEIRRLVNCESLIPALATARIEGARSLLERELGRIPVLVRSRIAAASTRLDAVGDMVSALSGKIVSVNGQKLSDIELRMATALRTALRREDARVNGLTTLINALSPVNTLRRGYSVTRVNGRAVTDASMLTEGTVMVTQLRDGSITSVVSQKPSAKY